MVRELAGYDVERAQSVLRWPLREALIAYRTRLMDSARASWRHETAVWAAIAPHSSKKSEPPAVPPILRELQ